MKDNLYIYLYNYKEAWGPCKNEKKGVYWYPFVATLTAMCVPAWLTDKHHTAPPQESTAAWIIQM